MADVDSRISRLCSLALCIFVDNEFEDMIQKQKDLMRSCDIRSRYYTLNIAR